MEILVVDDSPEIWTPIDIILSTAGHCPLFAESGETAMEMLPNRDVDLVLSDFHMRGINGIQLFRRVTEYKQALKFVLMSGDRKIRRIALENNLCFLEKPFCESELIDILTATFNDLRH